ncbi:MAG: L-aspartate oxidase [Chitinivibrionales bacterium]|nr:L-aspartate oxidase [Chitinivibrionales bacterium]
MRTTQFLRTDFLVIGSGIAGLCFAIHAAKQGRVIIVTKKKDSDCNTNYAQGGVACVLDPADSFQSHIVDTLTAGKSLCHEDMVRIMVEEGPARIEELLSWGANFTKSKVSTAFKKLDLGREGGHSTNRIVHTHDLTGSEIERTLLERVKKNPNVTVLENHCLVELITDHQVSKSSNNRSVTTCFGAFILNTENRAIIPIGAKITYIATGGIGMVYLHTTNPSIASGDGIACAYRAGAKIANMEFIQFHPTTLYHPVANHFLISEALRGFGAVLKDKNGFEFMPKYHALQSLAPRDIVARAIDAEMKISGDPCVFLDIRHKPPSAVRKRFPTIYAKCKLFGIDITKQMIPVVPACHYLCGGIQVDSVGLASIVNLYVGGEAGCTGVHGANRLASNSLLEALVFSKRSADHIAALLPEIKPLADTKIPCWDDSGTVDNEEWILISHNLKEIQTVMWDYVSIVRSNLRLKRAQRRIDLLERETENFYRRTKITMQLLELRNIVTVAKLIIASALKRRESRGLHFTTDYPSIDDKQCRDTIIQKPVTD